MCIPGGFMLPSVSLPWVFIDEIGHNAPKWMSQPPTHGVLDSAGASAMWTWWKGCGMGASMP